jgi:phosphopantetheinyl transferase (holo-ACP synthase)
VVYNVMQKSAWAAWKRLVAEGVFLSKMEVTNRTLGAPQLTTDYSLRHHIYVIFDGEYESNILVAVS